MVSKEDHANWNKPMREVSPHLAHLYPEHLTLGEHKFYGLEAQVNKLEVKFSYLEKSSRWFFAKVIGLITLYEIVGIYVERVGNSLGWW